MNRTVLDHWFRNMKTQEVGNAFLFNADYNSSTNSGSRAAANAAPRGQARAPLLLCGAGALPPPPPPSGDGGPSPPPLGDGGLRLPPGEGGGLLLSVLRGLRAPASYTTPDSRPSPATRFQPLDFCGQEGRKESKQVVRLISVTACTSCRCRGAAETALVPGTFPATSAHPIHPP